MQDVEFFYSKRSQSIEKWHPIYKQVEQQGYHIHTEPIECAVSVVLEGKLVNPLPLHGRKVLLYKMDEWQPMKWKNMFSPILEEYYDQMIDITGRDMGKVIEEICQTDF